ncbi:MAG TPA: hypothetical protein VFU06_04610 [Longimicrobiales bacterium]|nr:hypothetical protein [Longimicrobiales bacterium]
MVSLMSLWLPILVSALIVFFASAILHMLLPLHREDWAKLPDEEAARAALRNVPPNDYMVPRGEGMSSMKDPAFMQKYREGPVVLMTVHPAGEPSMGRNLAQWFVLSVIVSIFAAYVAGRALGPGAGYLEVFRFAGSTAFAAYALGQVQESIWSGRKWSTTLKNVLDALVYALLTAGVFGWLWP